MTYNPGEFLLGALDPFTPEEWYSFPLQFVEIVAESAPEGSPFHIQAKEVLDIRIKGSHINKKVLLAQKLETIVAEAKLLRQHMGMEIEKALWLLSSVYWPEDPLDAYFRAIRVHRINRGRFGRYNQKTPDTSPTLFPMEPSKETVPGCLFPGTRLPRIKRHRTQQ